MSEKPSLSPDFDRKPKADSKPGPNTDPFQLLDPKAANRARIKSEDTIVGAKMVNTRRGPVVERRFLVVDLEGPSYIIGALALQAAGIPRVNDLHPGIWGLPVSHVEFEPVKDSPSQGWVTAHYGYFETGGQFLNPPSESAVPEFEILGGVQPKDTVWDKNDDQIVTHILEAEDSENTKKVAGKVSIMVPKTGIRLRRREPFNPMAKSIAYRGHVNSIDINAVNNSRCWLCTRLDAVTDDRGLSWNVTYEFLYEPPTTNAHAEEDYIGGWDIAVVAEDPKTGEIMTTDHPRWADPPDGSVEVYRVYPEADFHALNLYI